ncbi:hypothetical protein CK489_30845 [Bradyrhizobium sp. UFLA03-84]|nr:hypothetical protein CK489_30845 [Bradyrhizobium sp. UFLA03-84]
MLAFGMGAARSERERRRQRAFGYRDRSKRRGTAGWMRRRRSGIRPGARHKRLLLGGAAKAVVRGWLENDGD